MITIEFTSLTINFPVILVFNSLFLFPDRKQSPLFELNVSVETQFPSRLPNLEGLITTHLDYYNNHPAGLPDLRWPPHPLYCLSF